MLIHWNSIEVFLRGARLEELARRVVEQKKLPVQHLSFHFQEGQMEISGRAIVAFPVPFSLRILDPQAAAGEIRVQIQQVSAFGFLPVPKLLFSMVEKSINREGLSFSAQTMTAVIGLDQFLPPFIDVEVTEIHFVEGGVAISLGKGGADPPIDLGGNHGGADRNGQ